MLLLLSPDQESLRDTTARYLGDKVPPTVLRQLRDHPDGFTEEYWRQGVQLGWTHLLVGEEQGGGSVSGEGIVDLALLGHEFGRHAAPGPLLVNALVAGVLAGAGNHQQIVDGLLAGTRRATWAPLDGPRQDELGDVRLTVRVEGPELVLDGEKRPVESASSSTHVLVTGLAEAGPTQVLVPLDAPGVEVTPLHSVDLTRRFDRVRFTAVRVDAAAAIGPIGGAAAELERQLQWALVVSNAESVGAMQVAFDMTLEWVFDRYSFGRPLASYQAIKHRMAAMKTWLEASHAIADESAAAVAAAAPEAGKLTSAAAAYIGERGSELLQECVQFHGGIGVTFEHDLHLYLRRHTLNRTLHGTPAEHRRRVAVALATDAGTGTGIGDAA